MYPQNHPGLNPVGKWGCYFCSLGRIAEDVTGKKLSEEGVMAAYAEAIDEGYMGWDCFLQDPGAVLEDFVYRLGVRGARASYIGWWNKDSGKGPQMFPGWHISQVTHEVERYKYKTYHHFRLVHFDPFPGLALGEMDGRRLFRVELPGAA